MVQGMNFSLSDAGPSFQVTRAKTWLLQILMEFQDCADSFSRKVLLLFLVVLEADHTVTLAVNIFLKNKLVPSG